MSTTEQDLQKKLDSMYPVEQPSSASSSPSAPSATAPTPPAPATPQASLASRTASDLAQGARDSLTSVWRGVTGAVTSVVGDIDSAEKKVGIGSPIDDLMQNHAGFTSWYMKAFDGSLMPDQSTSTTGKLIEGASQFAAGMYGAGKLLKIAPEAGTLLKIGANAVKGGAVDMTLFNSGQQRLSNLIQEHPALQNPLTSFLAGKPDDSFAVAKLKQGLEGVVTGVAMDGLIEGAIRLKASRIFNDAKVPASDAVGQFNAAVKQGDQALAEAKAGKPQGTTFTAVETPKGAQVKTSSGTVLPEVHPTIEQAASQANTLTMASTEQATKLPSGTIAPEDVEAIKAEASRIVTSTDPEDIRKLAEGTNFNFANVSGEDDAKAYIESVSKVMKDQIATARSGDLITHKQLLGQIADTYPTMDPNAIMGNLSKTFDNTVDMSVHVNASRVLLYNIADDVSKVSALVDGDPSNALNVARLGQRLDTLLKVQSMLAGTTTNVARTLESHSMDVRDIVQATDSVPNTVPAVAEDAAADGGASAPATDTAPKEVPVKEPLTSIQGMTPDDIRKMARRVRMADGDPAAAAGVVKNSPRTAPQVIDSFKKKVNTAIAVHNEWWINSLLSGPQTHTVKIMADISKSIMNPLEMLGAGVASRDPELRDQGAQLLIGQFAGARESFSAAYRALKIGDNVLTADAPTFGTTPDASGAIGGYLGQLVRLPTRLMTSEDEFFKQMAYRTNVRAQAIKQATSMGLTGEKLATYVSDSITSAFSPDGRGINGAAMDYAHEVTSTTPPTPGGASAAVSSFLTKFPASKMAMPFYSIATNLMSYAWNHTPIVSALSTQVRADMAAGGARRAMVLARWGTGTAVWGTAALLARAGKITGKGPGDPALNKQWRENGNQPYSVKVGDQWISYKRLDPVLMPVGVVADIVQASGELKGEDSTDLATGFVTSLSQNLTSKSYLVGLTQMMDALSSGSESKSKSFLEQRLSSYVPNILNEANPDDSMREVRGYVDSILSHVPGMSTTLPARRNLFGEPVMKVPGTLDRAFNPLSPSGKPKGDGVVEGKLLELGKAVSMPAKYVPGTESLAPGARVDMTSRQYGLGPNNETPYDRLLELTAHPANGGSLRDELTTLVKSPQWDSLSPGSSVEPGGLRLKLANGIIQAHRMAAMQQVTREFPLLNKAIDVARNTSIASKTQGEAGVQRIQALSKKE